MKKKRINIIKVILVLVLLVGIITGMLILFNVQNTKKYYNEYILITKNSNIYDSKNNKIGTIYEGSYLELDKYNNSKYFKIQDSDYYINSKDIKKTKKRESKVKDYYVSLGENITLKDNTKLYFEEKESVKINKGNVYEVIYKDDNYYYIKALGNAYGVKIDDVEKVTPTKGVIKQYVSILNYEKYSDNIDSQFKYLKEDGYFGITIEDFSLWLDGKININNKGILLLSNDEKVLEKAKEYDLYIEKDYSDYSFNGNNASCKKGTKTSISFYKPENMNEEDLKKALNGEPVAYIDISTKYNHNLRSSEGNATSIPVLNYHFFYDSSLGEYCGEDICLDAIKFERELYWLKENNYKTLTIDEFIRWVYGEIELPNRSVLLTIDDGAMGTGFGNGNKLIPLLEKYDMHATLFLIAGWHQHKDYLSPNLDVESHTYDMHTGGYCDDEPRGSQLLCSSFEEIKNDLALSKYELGTNNAFCYPMYVYNDKVVSAVKEMGYKVAFTGGSYSATRNDDKYKIPRYPIYESTSLDQFIDMLD